MKNSLSLSIFSLENLYSWELKKRKGKKNINLKLNRLTAADKDARINSNEYQEKKFYQKKTSKIKS